MTSAVTQRLALLFQWELWLIQVVFYMQDSSKVALPSGSLCGLPFQKMNNKSLVTNLHEAWAYTIILQALKKAHSNV